MYMKWVVRLFISNHKHESLKHCVRNSLAFNIKVDSRKYALVQLCNALIIMVLLYTNDWDNFAIKK